jgi:DNA polymerase III sliding clamp (beta) subunit (PCNA family)
MNETFKKLLKASKTHVVHFERSLAHFSHSPIAGLRITWGCESGHWHEGAGACGITGIPRIMADLVPEMQEAVTWDGPEGVESNISTAGLWEAILECWPYTNNDQTRLALNGVHIGVDGCVGLDGARMNLIAGPWGAHLTPDERHLIIPNSVIKMAKPLAKSLTTFRVYTRSTFTERNVWDEALNKLVPKLCEDKFHVCMMNFLAKDGAMFTASWDCADLNPYPNYRQVVPRQSSCIMEVNLDEMRAALAKAAPLASKNTQEIALTPVSGGWALEVRNHDLGISEYQQIGLIRCLPLEGSEIPPRIGFNLNYLLETIGKKAKTAVFKMNTPTQAVVIDRIGTFDDASFKIIMPLRLVD